jgi:hypothetical protein
MCDYTSYQPNLHFQGKKRFYTPLGIIFTLIASILLVSVCCIYLSQLLLKKNAIIVYNQTSGMNININMSNSPLIFELLDNSGNSIIEPEKVFELVATSVKVNLPGKSNKISSYEMTDIPFEKCNDTFKQIFPSLKEKDLSKLDCIRDSELLNLKGAYGDSVKGYKYINIYLSRCVNSTKNNFHCKGSEEINKILDDVILYVFYKDFEIDHRNNFNPFKKVLKSSVYKLSTSIYKNYVNYFKSVEYYTDQSLIIEDIEHKNGYSYQSLEFDFNFKKGSAISKAHFSQITFAASDKVDEYYRSFPKICFAIAHLGGFLKFVLIMFQIICYFPSKRIYFSQFSNILVKNTSNARKSKHDNFKLDLSNLNMINRYNI